MRKPLDLGVVRDQVAKAARDFIANRFTSNHLAKVLDTVSGLALEVEDARKVEVHALSVDSARKVLTGCGAPAEHAVVTIAAELVTCPRCRHG